MFDSKTDLSNNHFHSFTNERWGTTNLDNRVRKTAQNYENYRTYNGAGVQFTRAVDTEDDSGVSSPPLWKNNYRYLSPNSRTQAITRGQWELMEMVKTMPESCYELSLKDLVEHHHHPIKVESEEEEEDDDCLVDAKSLGRKSVRQESKKKNIESSGKAKMARSTSIENNGGLLLKMAFPFSLGSKKTKTKKKLGTNSFSRVSPRPEYLDRSGKGGAEEWWKKRFSSSSESDSGGSQKKKSGCSPGCWSFLAFSK